MNPSASISPMEMDDAAEAVPRQTSRMGRWIEVVGERINPVLLKELKQATQARSIAWLLKLYITFNVVILGLVLLWSDLNITTSQVIGRNTFFGLLVCLQIAAAIVVPSFVAARLTAERSSDDLDLVLATSISPSALIRGKLLSGMVLITLLYSIALPFLAFTFMLRGIDLPSILVIVGASYLSVAPVLQLAILLACLPVRRLVRIVLLALAAVSLFYLIPLITIMVSIDLVGRGVGGLATSPGFWRFTGTMLLIELCVMVILHAWSIASLSPRAANRSLPGRVACTGAWLCSAAVVAVLASNAGGDAVAPWFFISISMLGVLTLAATSERDEPGPRVAQQVPRHPGLRVLAFPFFTGAVNGLVWCGLMSMLTLGVVALGRDLLAWDIPRSESMLMLGASLATQHMCYALAAYGLHRYLRDLGRTTRPAWLLGVSMMAVGSILVALLDILGLDELPGVAGMRPWKAPSPLATGDDGVQAAVLYLGLPAALILVALVRRRVLRQIRSFTPHAAEPGAHDPPAAER